ncbi:MAG: threonine-phosphate decarboxylase [Deltaproteobacteria bacterium]|nr:threonine-phosphate decarboxylase [Deltaproteobacteria bacterium]
MDDNRDTILPVHGGGVFRKASESGIPVAEIIDFSANINPLGLPAGVDAVLCDSLRYLAHYPEIDGDGLARQIARRHRLERVNVLVGNGSTALIYLLARVLKPGKALLWSPTFTEYGRALKLVSCRVENLISWREGEKFPLKEMIRQTLRSEPELIFICNPNNPTGSLWLPEELEQVIRACEQARITCCIDEAFIDFVGPGYSLADRIARFDNLIILRSLTKIYALAGLRCGYLLCSSGIGRRLQPFVEPWSVSYPALEAAAAALANDVGFLAETVAFIESQRRYLYSQLQELGYLSPYLSRANYILAKMSDDGKASKKLTDYLFQKHWIMVRTCEDYAGLDKSYLRMAVKGEDDNRKLIDALRNFEF